MLSFKPIKFKRTSLEDSEVEKDKPGEEEEDDRKSVSSSRIGRDSGRSSSLRRSASAVDLMRSSSSLSTRSSRSKKSKSKKKKRSHSSESDSSDDDRKKRAPRRRRARSPRRSPRKSLRLPPHPRSLSLAQSRTPVQEHPLFLTEAPAVSRKPLAGRPQALRESWSPKAPLKKLPQCLRKRRRRGRRK